MEVLLGVQSDFTLKDSPAIHTRSPGANSVLKLHVVAHVIWLAPLAMAAIPERGLFEYQCIRLDRCLQKLFRWSIVSPKQLLHPRRMHPPEWRRALALKTKFEAVNNIICSCCGFKSLDFTYTIIRRHSETLYFGNRASVNHSTEYSDTAAPPSKSRATKSRRIDVLDDTAMVAVVGSLGCALGVNFTISDTSPCPTRLKAVTRV